MDKAQLRIVAEQLARPNGDLGTDISSKMNETNAFITARSIDALAPQSGEFIVELGPGNGVLSRGLVQTLGNDGRYLGIEVSQDMVPVAEKVLRGAGKGDIRVHAGDCHTAIVDAASVDGMMAVNVLYFVKDLDGLLAHIRPWFRNGGRCVFGIRPVETLQNLCFHEFGFHIRSPEIIESALHRNGFGEISITEYDEAEGKLGEITFPNGSIIIKSTV